MAGIDSVSGQDVDAGPEAGLGCFQGPSSEGVGHRHDEDQNQDQRTQGAPDGRGSAQGVGCLWAGGIAFGDTLVEGSPADSFGFERLGRRGRGGRNGGGDRGRRLLEHSIGRGNIGRKRGFRPYTGAKCRAEQTNQVRETLGIRPIKKTWLFCYRQFSEETWKDGEFLCKKVARSGVGTAILWEEDYYYSGSTYIDINGGKNWESLTVGYNYGSRQFYLGYVGVSPTLNSLVETLPRSTSVGMMGETNGQTILTADKILTGWNRVRTD